MAGAQRPGRFRPGELDAPELGPGAEAELLGTAREVEWLAATEDVGPSADFADRVMAVVSREPAPQPIAAALGAARRRNPLAALGALGDVWRVAFTGGRPFAVRLPAMALVALLVLGSLGVGAIGAGALAGLVGPAPTATPQLSPSPTPSPPPSPSPSPSPAATDSPQPSGTPEATESPTPSGTPESSGTPAATDDDDDNNGRPTATARPAARPTARPTPRPTLSPGATETPDPDESPTPTGTQRPTETPSPTETSGRDGGGHEGG